MTDAELTRLIAHELQKVAPEADPASLSPDQPIREAVDIDSFDFLRVLIALSEATGVEIPEADYGKLTTLKEMVHYFRAHLTVR
ncbi:MAG: phosphopantetheine-binding protein [Vicinamibacterales bacterium]